MPGLHPHIDPDGLLEYSVVFTDRALNHMSASFQGVMNDISHTLKMVHNAHAVALVPGGGTFAMEAVARQFASGVDCLVIRNGLFSFRWSQILATGNIAANCTVLKARPSSDRRFAPYAPPPLDEVTAAIATSKPRVVFAPHVETASGILLPDTYIETVADSARASGGLFVLDCIASGALWVDMEASGVDILISAPQKGWSASPSCGLVMMNARAREQIESTVSSSFACDLLKWLHITEAYESGGHAYHATMPTDALSRFRETAMEIKAFGFERARTLQWELGEQVRALLAEAAFESVSAEGFQAPGVVVSYTDEAGLQNGSWFAEAGLQIAAGVPLQLDEPEDFQTFRIGLFGLDKLQNIGRTVEGLKSALEQIRPHATG